jgi:energy-coupling factor transport system ATP-binding protein
MAIELKQVNYIYDMNGATTKQALQNVNLVMNKGEFIGLVGHTGSGKSTLVQHLNGLVAPTEGQVLFDGADIHEAGYDKKHLRSKVGVTFQYPEYQLFEETVLKDVAFGPKNLGYSEEEAIHMAKEALDFVGVKEKYFGKSPFELSGGQKRRVAIAGVLAMQPDYLVLDEPTAGLDPLGRTRILEQIYQLYRERGITVILVSHSMEDVATYATRMIVMSHGTVAYDGTPRGAFSKSEELNKLGLMAPAVTRIMEQMKAEGMDVPTDVITMEEAVAAIKHMKGIN